MIQIALFSAAAVRGGPADYVNAQLPSHKPVLDSYGKLLAWHEPARNLGYDKVLRLGWDFIEHKVPKDTRHNTGLKIYLINSVFDGETLQGSNWQHNPAMVYASFVDGLAGWYPYSGDEEAIRTVREMLNHQLAHGTTPAGWKWPGVPFATNCDDEPDYGRCIQNMPHEFHGGIETDKIAELGTGYLLFHEMTGERKYLDAALRCADALARHVRPGDEDNTPWPFRLDARTGVTLAREEYGGNVAASVRLFDELLRLGVGDNAAYQKARDTAWNWLLRFPLNRGSKAWDKWSGYFEDVAKDTTNVNQMSPTITAYYLLTRENPSSVDREWRNHVSHAMDWVRQRFGRGPYFGAWAIDEQGTPDGRGCCSRAGLSSHTSRWAAINAIYAERTGDAQAREDAFRSMNYATYFAASDGRVSCCGVDFGGQYWFSDGYSDYLRHFNWIMGALPELAPAGENHLLRSTSVVQKIRYDSGRVEYKTFDHAAIEVLRLAFRPSRVSAGNVALSARGDLSQEGYTIEQVSNDYVLRLRHAQSGAVRIEMER